MQHPSAEQVAGFRAWLKLGYCVRKGETGIRIWAPCPPTRKQIETWERNGSKSEERPRTFFKLAAVFAQDQVDELPLPAEPITLGCPMRVIEGDDLAEVLPRLVSLAKEIGSKVSFARIAGDARGFYEPATKRIVVEAELPANQQAATLCHELAHALVRAEATAEDPVLAYASEELVAESVAFTCIRSLGIESEMKSIPYMASWAEQADLGVLEKCAGLIDRLARRIEDVLHEETKTWLPDRSAVGVPMPLLLRGCGRCRLDPYRRGFARCKVAALPSPPAARSVPLGTLAAVTGRRAQPPIAKEQNDGTQRQPQTNQPPTRLPPCAGEQDRNDVHLPGDQGPGKP